MPAGYSSRCRVCNSPHRGEIEQWLAEGLSPRAVSAKLQAEFGERISHQSIWKHRDEHFNIAEEAARQYVESQTRLEQVAARRVDEIRLLEEQIAEAAELRSAYATWLKDCQQRNVKPPQSVVQAYGAAAGEVRQSARTKAELLGEDAASRAAQALESWLELAMYADADQE